MLFIIIGARLQAASFSYRMRPREKSPKTQEQSNEGTISSISTNGTTPGFRTRSSTAASFFRKKKKQELMENEGKENGDAVTTRM